MWYYTEMMCEYREVIDPIDISLEKIKSVIFKYLGVKDEKIKREAGIVESDISRVAGGELSTMRITIKQKEAWLKAGMPNPYKFFRKRR